MTKLIWGAAGQRFYEAGVDRGVLYVGDTGVSWSGLKAVKEVPTGGEPTPYYIDGVKYLNLSTAEEYAATIEAFSSPAEFAVCDGSVMLAAGLFLTQQPRQSFGFSYRTRIGNDIEDGDFGYKLHLVYNALAGPSGRANNSLDTNVGTMDLAWPISTKAPKFAGHVPSAHLLLDSRLVPRLLMAAIEEILYGNDLDDPRLPTAEELIALFQTRGPLVGVNLWVNPDLRYTPSAGQQIIRTNLARNPEPFIVADYFGPGAKTLDVFSDGTPAVLFTLTATTTAYVFSTGANGTFPPGQVITMSADVEFPDLVPGETYQVRAHSQTGNVYYSVSSKIITPVAGKQRVFITFTTPAAPLIPNDDLNLSLVGTNRNSGYRIKIGAVLIERTAFLKKFFSGRTPADYQYNYSFSGTADNSPSYARSGSVGRVEKAGTNGGIYAYNTEGGDPVGMGMTEVDGAVMNSNLAIEAGSFMAVSCDVTNIGQVASTFRLAIWDEGYAAYAADVTATVLPGEKVHVSAPSKAPTAGPFPKWYIYLSTTPASRTEWLVENMSLKQVAKLGVSADPFISGRMEDTPSTQYEWSDPAFPDDSSSLMYSWD